MELYSKMFDANVRMEAVWPFPVGEPSESLAEAFEDADDRLPQELQDLIASWDEDERDELFGGEGSGFNDAYEELCAKAFREGVSGWIGIAATPVMTPSSHGGCSFSWGHYRTKFLFAPTADGLLEAAIDWASAEYQRAVSAPA